MTDWPPMISSQPENSTTTGKQAELWFGPGRFAALLGLLLGATFLGVVSGHETFFYRDFGVFTFPVAHYYRECFWRGELPLWNPLNNCGIPLLAQWNTAILYPFSLFYLVFPLSWSLGVFNVGHLFLAGMGMYFLARRWTGSNFAASVAGIIFAFNGLSWHMLVWISNLAAWAWMPWVTLAVEQAWRRGGKRNLILAALAGAMQMLTGAPEIIFLTWAFLASLWLASFALGGIPRGKMFGRFAVVILLVTGLSAAQLLPFVDLLAHSHRDAGFGDADWSMPVFGLGNFLVPLLHCYPAAYGVYVQHDQYWTSSYYLGAGAMVLGLTAAWQVRNRRVWLLLAVLVISLAMALGPHGYLYSALRAAFPFLGFMRYPIKFVVLPVLLIPLLAACCVSWCLHVPPGSKQPRNALRLTAIFSLMAMALIVWLAWKHPMTRDNWPVTWHNALTRSVFVIMAPAILLWLRSTSVTRAQRALQLALLLLLWLDVLTQAPRLNPTIDRSVYQPGLIREQMKLPAEARADEPRVMETLAAMDTIRYLALSKPVNDFLCRRLALYDNCNLLDGIPKIDGFYSLFLRESDQLVSRLYACDSKNIELKGLKDFLGVSRISAPDTAPGKILDWVARDSFLPLATAGQKPVFADETNTLNRLSETDFDPRQTVYLPPEAAHSITATRNEAAKIQPRTFSAQSLSLEVETSAPTLAVVAQAYYHPWRAYVDGRLVRLWKANFAFQALEVPAGRHEVKLVYEDLMFDWGAVISLATLLGLGVGWFWPRRRVSCTQVFAQRGSDRSAIVG